MTLDKLLSRVRQVLAEGDVNDAPAEARKLTLGLLEIAPASWLADPEQLVDDGIASIVLERAHQRAEGMPLHRILGWREFHGLQLALSHETLEPRDDTEAIVDLCLKSVRMEKQAESALRILDLGTGTGAIALALLKELPRAVALGIDLSADALQTAEKNALNNGLADRFSIRQSDWFEGVEGCFDLIVSNPPYIESGTIAELDTTVRDYDPHLALDGGFDGLDAYRIIAATASSHLRPGGKIGVEIGRDQEDDVAEIFQASGLRCVDRNRDLNGIWRAMLFQIAE
ncbi:peptide chain release factor N(5)-glutamine methyltransferase [Notoacmeibacter sp. MSK16QG-6]|uniref:peptide chain release factor N(5)-glutamine methyltransferase n=1 Tax=Notoacmeibacter sp. MSK16QG-6 TaxID=2957982 RepID=UPI0020A0E158|nr:peptide chain release factor N(5)-glutamine methyltransferase [Notoacmeibacter sp. MSK16QG-6]MCP1199936.1 peptide chain release factor N(5)-glutamine methyltransferase [Notoacmeibacter sp. MSK16QG-6]